MKSLLVHRLLYVCLLIGATAPNGGALPSPGANRPFSRRLFARGGQRRQSKAGKINMRGGPVVEIVTYKFDAWSVKMQQRYIGVSLAVLTFPSITWLLIRIISTSCVMATILNAIKGNGLVVDSGDHRVWNSWRNKQLYPSWVLTVGCLRIDCEQNE